MTGSLLVTGGVLREGGYELGEGKYYGSAKLLRLDLTSANVEVLLSIDEGNAHYPAEHPNLQFTAGDVDGDRVWLTTDTEVRAYRYPAMELLACYSHPCFHNLHSVAVRGPELWVTSTGLDMVVVLDKADGRILQQHSVVGKPLWQRFSEQADYRMVHSTRPHEGHPNFVFWVGGEPWVTRCTQEDAVMLRDPSRSLDISGPRRPISVHDGAVHEGRVYFTCVDGSVVIADEQGMLPLKTLHVGAMAGFGGLRGWCRGLLVRGGILYLAFSRLRRTRRLDKLRWLGRWLEGGDSVEECSVLAVDLARETIVGDYRIPPGTLDAIYSLLPEPSAR